MKNPSHTEPSQLPNLTEAQTDGAAIDRTIIKRLVGHTVKDVERELICETLMHCLGNRTRAARVLGLSIRGLRYKAKAYVPM